MTCEEQRQREERAAEKGRRAPARTARQPNHAMANAVAARGTLIGAHASSDHAFAGGVLARDEEKEGGGTATRHGEQEDRRQLSQLLAPPKPARPSPPATAT
ncbi:MAG: hypothetical protein QOK16_382 [Solirubrobacteraceae bacterium]|jgi:hypothetical protein|nr:hypothetical protein [Solirubrobacteraceae bacterium]